MCRLGLGWLGFRVRVRLVRGINIKVVHVRISVGVMVRVMGSVSVRIRGYD